ncbi:MAG TPA: fructose-1,6-bisphosphate aldolase/phosphatase [archaeon]|nr:fructose-1,6-bisphosphate aldolase/phosphatase [archaeon]
MGEKTTLSLIKADCGSWVGHNRVHPDMLEAAKECLQKAKNEHVLIDYFVTNCGDDLELLMSHNKFIENKEIHKLAFDTFVKCSDIAKKLKLYAAGQDILSTAFSGNVKGMGPGVCEIAFEERKSEPVVVFMADKTEPGAWNFPLYKIFADPFNTAGLVIDPNLHGGFTFEVHDVMDHKKVKFACPQEIYDLLLFIGSPGRYCIKSITRSSDGEIAAVSSTEKLNFIAQKYVGKDDPVLIVRAQSGFPAVGEILEPFALPFLVEGWCRGSHWGPVFPCSQKDATPTRFDGPPRVVALGFQLNNGKLEGPIDMFEDKSFDLARQKSNEIADYMRRHGAFEAQRLSLEAMEYTTYPEVEKKLRSRWEKI